MRKFICWLIVALSFNAYAVEFSSTLGNSGIAKLPQQIVVIAKYQEVPADVEQFDAQLLVINAIAMLEAILNIEDNNISFSTEAEAVEIVRQRIKAIEPKIQPMIQASFYAGELLNKFGIKTTPAIIINDCFVSAQASVRVAISEWRQGGQCNAE